MNISNDYFNSKVERVLVCITVQANSKRLIKKGAEIAKEKSGQLHILHIQKGNNIFINTESAELLQELYKYGSELGGEIHALCGEDVCEIMLDFSKKMEVTSIVLGEGPKCNELNSENNIINKIKRDIPSINIIVLERNKI